MICLGGVGMWRPPACCQENRSKSKSFVISGRYEIVFFVWLDRYLFGITERG